MYKYHQDVQSMSYLRLQLKGGGRKEGEERRGEKRRGEERREKVIKGDEMRCNKIERKKTCRQMMLIS